LKSKIQQATYVNLFGGFITDLRITVDISGSSATTQRINIIAVGALARLSRAVYTGNFAHQFDGDSILGTYLEGVLFNQWNEVPAALTWATYEATTPMARCRKYGTWGKLIPQAIMSCTPKTI
jgi:hypothetical protein